MDDKKKWAANNLKPQKQFKMVNNWLDDIMKKTTMNSKTSVIRISASSYKWIFQQAGIMSKRIGRDVTAPEVIDILVAIGKRKKDIGDENENANKHSKATASKR